MFQTLKSRWELQIQSDLAQSSPGLPAFFHGIDSDRGDGVLHGIQIYLEVIGFDEKHRERMKWY